MAELSHHLEENVVLPKTVLPLGTIRQRMYSQAPEVGVLGDFNNDFESFVLNFG